MNVYWIETKEIEVVDCFVPYQDWEVPIYTDTIEAGVVVAETPGQARATFIDHFSRSMWTELEWTDIKTVRLIDRGVNCPRGYYECHEEWPHDDPLWRPVCDKIWPTYWDDLAKYCSERERDTDQPWDKYPEFD